MAEEIEFINSEKIPLRKIGDEKWLQDKVEEDPSILGLGNLEVLEREHTQSSGGRIDFLLRNEDGDTFYEVEIQLGKTDPSHIIRTIEYWDNQKRRYPNQDHRAVLVAEDITNRFFNVVYLMNKAIPIIAIQLNVLKIGIKVTLDFTKVLDIYETPEEEFISEIDPVDEAYWNRKTNPIAMQLVNDLINLSEDLYPSLKKTYNKYHIALGTTKRNCLWIHPRKNKYINVSIKILNESLEDLGTNLNEIGITPREYNRRRETINLNFPIKENTIERYKENLKEILKKVLDMSS